jgi:hypothetical protein
MWVLALGAGCVEPRVTIDVPIVGGGTGVVELATVDGGAVTFDEVQVTFADLRLEEPAESSVASALRALSPIQAAYAHPGHDYPGDVAGELLGTFTVDVLAPDSELGVARCYEGAYATGRVTLAGAVAAISGTYTSAAGDAWPFRFEVDADQEIAGIPFEATMSAGDPPTSVDVRFDLHGALSHVDWTAPDTDADGALTNADETYSNTVRFGVVATPSWTLEAIHP